MTAPRIARTCQTCGGTVPPRTPALGLAPLRWHCRCGAGFRSLARLLEHLTVCGPRRPAAVARGGFVLAAMDVAEARGVMLVASEEVAK